MLRKEYSMNSGISIVPFLPFKMRDVSVHATRAAGGHHLLTNFKHHLISLCWSCRVLWLEGSGTVADAKHNKRKAVEYQGEVGGENNNRSQQTERAKNTRKMDRKLTLTDKVQGSKSLQIEFHPTKVSVPSDVIEDLIWAFWINADFSWTNG